MGNATCTLKCCAFIDWIVKLLLDFRGIKNSMIIFIVMSKCAIENFSKLDGIYSILK
jgi:hypothetical protein